MHETITTLTLSEIYESIVSRYPRIHFLGVFVGGKFGIFQNSLKNELNHMALQSFCMTYLSRCVDDNDEINMDFNKAGWFMFKKAREEFWLIIGANNHDYELISEQLGELDLGGLQLGGLFGSLQDQRKANSNNINSEKVDSIIKTRTLNIETADGELPASYLELDSLLPDLSPLGSHFELFFSYYSPEDEIGSDFYWYKEMDDHVLFAVGDCTGHNLEGELSMMVVNTLINQNVSDDLMGSVELVYSELKKYSSTGSGYTIGVEMVLCNYHKNKGTLEVLSTGIPVLYLDRHHSGFLLKPKGNTKVNKVNDRLLHQHLNVSKGERVVIYTDGLADQLDHEDRKKLGNSGIKRMFESMNGNFSKETFYKEFTQWKGKNVQTDDITVMAFEI